MKILHVIDKMDPRLGGVSQAVRTIVSGLNSLGMANEVVSLDDQSQPFTVKDSFPIYALGPGKTTWGFSTKLISWLFKNLSNYDVIIVHGLWLFNGFAVLMAIKRKLKRGKPDVLENGVLPKFFVMPHGMLDPYFQKATVRGIKVVRNWIYWTVIERHLIKRVDGLLFTTMKEKELAKNTFWSYKPKNELVVGLGVEQPPEYSFAMKEAFYQKHGSSYNYPYLLFLGRIDSKKGLDLLVKAFSKVKSGRNTFLKLIIAGPGLETSYGKGIQDYVLSSNSLKNSVSFVGMLSGAAKWGAFYGCDAFILPSHQENFGIAVVEALACGKPVLISDQVNIWEEIKVGGAGLIEPDTLDGTTSLIETWTRMTDSEKQLMSRNAKAVYANTFSVNRTSTQLVSLLTNVVHQL